MPVDRQKARQEVRSSMPEVITRSNTEIPADESLSKFAHLDALGTRGLLLTLEGHCVLPLDVSCISKHAAPDKILKSLPGISHD